MSSLKDFKIKQGFDYDLLKTNRIYISQLAVDGALEIDNYLRQQDTNFGNVKELAEILGEYQLKVTDDAITGPNFPYLTLWRAVNQGSNKTLVNLEDLAMEMQLLRSELNDIPANPRRLEDMRDWLVNMSRVFASDQGIYSRPRLVR